MTLATDLFIGTARSVTIGEAAERLGLRFLRDKIEHPHPCPACGGDDRFSFKTKKGVWNCRGGAGGRDAISLAAHVLGLDVRIRAEFLEVRHVLTGDPIPDSADTMTDVERTAHRQKLERRRAANAAAAERLEAEGNRYRESERAKARGIFDHARPQIVGTQALSYLQHRLVCSADQLGPLHVRFAPAQTFWHGVDDRGHPNDIYQGPAMIGRFEDHERIVIGCHITWIDLDRPPKFRPDLGVDDKGRRIPSKKMRGTKKGGLIPIAGVRDASRWVIGEGIESASLTDLVSEFIGETSDVSRTVLQADADGEITPRERKSILKEIREAQDVITRLRRRIGGG